MNKNYLILYNGGGGEGYGYCLTKKNKFKLMREKNPESNNLHFHLVKLCRLIKTLTMPYVYSETNNG